MKYVGETVDMNPYGGAGGECVAQSYVPCIARMAWGLVRSLLSRGAPAAWVQQDVQGAAGTKRNSHLIEALLRTRGSEMDSWKRFSRVSLAVAVIALFVLSAMPTG